MSVDPISFAGNRLRFFGFASGLDIDQIVSQLMQAERIPLDRLQQRRQLLVWTKEDYWNINTLLDQLRQTLTPLKLTSTFQARSAVSSNPTVATATAAPGTPQGTYTLNVTQLARGIQMASSGPITLSSPPDRTNLWTQFGIDSGASPTIRLTLQVTDSAGTRTQTFTFDVARNDDIYDVVAAINNSNLGLTASYDATVDRLFISSRDTGARVTLTVTDATVTMTDATTKQVWAQLFKLPTTASGQDAVFDLNGATGLTEPTNQFTIAGVTYNLKSVGTTTITVSQDTDSIVQAIKTFVDKYNEVLGAINGKVSERRLYDYMPLTDAQKKQMTPDEIKAWEQKARQGLLQGDSLLISIASRMRLDVSSRVQGTGSTYNTLSSVGITTGLYFEGGRLYVDETKLRDALTKDPDGVARLFTASGATWDSQGVAIRLGSTLDNSIGRIRTRAGISGLEVDSSGLGRQIGLLDEQIRRMEQQLEDVEARYYSQFTLMETVLSQLGAQSMWLSQQFAATG